MWGFSNHVSFLFHLFCLMRVCFYGNNIWRGGAFKKLCMSPSGNYLADTVDSWTGSILFSSRAQMLIQWSHWNSRRMLPVQVSMSPSGNHIHVSMKDVENLLPWKRFRFLEGHVSARQKALRVFSCLVHKNIWFHMQSVTTKFACCWLSWYSTASPIKYAHNLNSCPSHTPCVSIGKCQSNRTISYKQLGELWN